MKDAGAMKRRAATSKRQTIRRRKKATPALTIPDCKRFTGYRPCYPESRCYTGCADPDPIGKKILIVNLDAMGNVLATTALLPPLKRKYPVSSLFWITLRNAAPLLANNPYLDRVFLWEPESWMVLQQMEFDLVLNVDKSQRSGAFTLGLKAKRKMGFGINAHGAIVPLNAEARDNYILGLDDHLKFRVNTKTVPQLQCEQFALKYRRDGYVVHLTDEELAFCREYKRDHGLTGEPGTTDPLIVGLNTGCSELYPNKKMTIEQHLTMIHRLSSMSGIRILLVGGPEDTERNAEIARRAEGKVLNTPTREGVRRGLCYLNLCDVVISGDSFGMHAAIALRKHLIVWFGLSCSSEIDLFGRGIKLVPEGLACSPCWKRECPYGLECITMIDLDAMVSEVERVATERVRT